MACFKHPVCMIKEEVGKIYFGPVGDSRWQELVSPLPKPIEDKRGDWEEADIQDRTGFQDITDIQDITEIQDIPDIHDRTGFQDITDTQDISHI